MTLLPVVLAGLAAAVALGRPPVGAHRLRDLRPRRVPVRASLSTPVAAGLAGIAVAVVVGFPAGLVLGSVVAVAAPVLLGRLEPAAVRRDRLQLISDLPLVLDLLAACMAGGAALPAAAASVARAVPGPCGARLMSVTDALAVGSPPGEAWLCLSAGRPDDPLEASARLMARAAEGGTPVAAAVSRLAAEARAVSRAAGAERARRVGVLVVAPLGLCFLPAFVLLGILPVVAGLAEPLLATF